MDLPRNNVLTSSSEPVFKLNSINLDQLHATNKKISVQSPLHLDQNTDYTLYHTTIPMYVVMFSACALISGLLYRKYRPTLRKISRQGCKESQTIFEKKDKESTPFQRQKGLILVQSQLNLRQASILAVLRGKVLRKANL